MEIELQQLEAKLATGTPDADSLIQYLRLAREAHIRVSDSVCQYGSLVLQKHKGALSDDELWAVYEQVAIAAMDCSAGALAASCIKTIANQFPASFRAKRLQGMYYETIGSFDRAEAVYKDMLEAEPSNELALKRQIALEKTKGNTTSAIEALRKFVDVFQNDVESWQELGELYLEVMMYKQAAFCYEELLTLQPGNMSHHLKYADILYTLGGNNNLRAARAYYAKALEVSGGHSLRAMYGICACYANLTEKVVLQDSKSRAQIELPTLTASAIVDLYTQNAPDKLPLVKALLDNIGL